MDEYLIASNIIDWKDSSVILKNRADTTLTDHNRDTALDISQKILLKQRQIKKFIESNNVTADR